MYIDPITGNNKWGMVVGSTPAGKGIIGIHSLSEAVPIKKDNFDEPFGYFKNKKTYQDWVFTTLAQSTDASAAPPPVDANPGNPAKPPKTPVAPSVPGAGGPTSAPGPLPPSTPPGGAPPAPSPGARPAGPVPSTFMPAPTPVPFSKAP
jgi:hypothetical protein